MKEMKGLFILFAVIGIGLLIGGVALLMNTIDFRKNAIEAEAVITDIDRHFNTDGETEYEVYVEFKVNGTTYGGRLGYYSSGMRVGGKTKIYYDPSNPNRFRNSSNLFPIIMFIIGIGFSIPSISMLFNLKNKAKSKKNLLEYGTRIYANFEEVRKNTCFEYNGRNPYLIICQSNNPEVKEYVSDNIWRNPESIIKERNITAFPVYIDPENPKKYYLSTEEIKHYITQK